MAKKRGKAKDRITLAPSWDMGAAGPANRHGLVIEERGEIDTLTGRRMNPNGVKGVRRVDMLEYYHRQGVITTRGRNAGEKLRDAWELTELGPGWSDNDRVQSSPRPDRAIAMQVDRMTALLWISRRVPQEHAAIIEHVAINSGSISGVVIKGKQPYLGANNARGKEVLRIAFDALADAVGC